MFKKYQTTKKDLIVECFCTKYNHCTNANSTFYDTMQHHKLPVQCIEFPQYPQKNSSWGIFK